MSFMNRRHFLAITAATLPTLKSLAQTPVPPAVSLTLHPDQPGHLIPANYFGLSYETQQLSDPTFFSSANTGLIAQFRALTPHGVLRIGGNTSDVGWWKPTPASKQPPLPSNVFVAPPRPGDRPFQELAYSVTPEAVTNLRGFLDATGWTCLYGINLGSSTPQRAAEEATFVAKTLGSKLEYFQVGNEADGFPSRFRNKATWTADTYFDDWLASANAIRAAVPNARFGMPDVASHVDWFEPIVNRLLAMTDRPEIVALTHHYYFTGPPSNPKANFNDLLKTDPKALHNAELARVAAEKLHTQFRMTEGNTCYRGGKPGFSDCFGAALWAADYLLTLASLGYSGVNLHGGDGKAVADSLGGTLPGELLMPDPNAPHPRPFYTPIAKINGSFVAEPIYFGIKFAATLAGAQLFPLDFNPGTVNATAYAATLPSGQQVVAIINKDQTQPLHFDLARYSLGLTLSAPSLTSTRVELSEPASFREASLVPPATAVLLYQS